MKLPMPGVSFAPPPFSPIILPFAHNSAGALWFGDNFADASPGRAFFCVRRNDFASLNVCRGRKAAGGRTCGRDRKGRVPDEFGKRGIIRDTS
jgi:hypothetical protein